jgi:hypothetical protein
MEYVLTVLRCRSCAETCLFKPSSGVCRSAGGSYTGLMSVHVAEATVDPLGRLVLDHLPFQPGEKVDVVVRSHSPGDLVSADLHGSVLHYENPFAPVAEGDWESSR